MQVSYSVGQVGATPVFMSVLASALFSPALPFQAPGSQESPGSSLLSGEGLALVLTKQDQMLRVLA